MYSLIELDKSFSSNDFMKFVPIIAPLEYLHASLNDFLSEIPNPIILGFFKDKLFILLKY